MTPDTLVTALSPIIARVRTDVCWRMNPGKSPCRIKEPLTDAKLQRHVNGGGPRYGVAPILPGTSATKIGLLDFDSHRGEMSWDEMRIAVLRVMESLRRLGLSPIPFRSSGGQGIHLYVLWETAQDAYSVRSLLRQALQSAGFVDGTRGVSQREVEVFPKQNAVAEGKFGNMFILPFAGQSSPLDVGTLDDMGRINAHSIRWSLSENVPMLTLPAPSPAPQLSIKGVEQEQLKLSSALDAIPYCGADRFGYYRFLHFVFALHHASGGASEGLELVHAFFRRAAEYNLEEINNLWANAKSHPQGGHPVTAATIYYEARKHGWNESADHEFDGFATKSQGSGPKSLPPFLRNDRGDILLTADNMVKAVERSGICGMEVAYDTFRDEIMYSVDEGRHWEPFKDADYTRLRINLERKGFKPPTKEMARDAVLFVAMAKKFDSAQVWLNSLEWDGVNRVDTFLHTYMGTGNTPYHREVSRYLWTALSGRVLSPGCKADMAPVLVGRQGSRKSSAVAAMAPGPKYFAELSFSESDDDLSRKMRGRMVADC